MLPVHEPDRSVAWTLGVLVCIANWYRLLPTVDLVLLGFGMFGLFRIIMWCVIALWGPFDKFSTDWRDFNERPFSVTTLALLTIYVSAVIAYHAIVGRGAPVGGAAWWWWVSCATAFIGKQWYRTLSSKPA